MGVRDGGRVEGFVSGIEVDFEDLFAALFQPAGEVPKEMSDRLSSSPGIGFISFT